MATIRLNDDGTILEYTVIDELDVAQDISSATTKTIIFTKPDGTTTSRVMSFTTDGSEGKVKYTLVAGDIDQQGLWKYQVYIGSPSGHWTSESYDFVVQDDSRTNIVYLLPYLRLKLGDINSTSYRYLDEWLVVALVAAVRSLARYWRDKYNILDSGDITRSTTAEFINDAPPTLEYRDEMIVIIKAAIITLQGSLESSSWSLASWRDAEMSVSYQEMSRTKNDNLTRLQNELDMYLVYPTKRLAKGRVNALPGYLGNIVEHPTDL